MKTIRKRTIAAIMLMTGTAFAQTNTQQKLPACTAASYITFDADGEQTYPISINSKGSITGEYFTENNTTGVRVYRGFVRAANGKITTFTMPGLGTGGNAGNNEGTHPISINSRGEIAGYYADANTVYHGFVRAANGEITTFNAPDADAVIGTYVSSMNSKGEITGWYFGTDQVYHGFVRAARGAFTTFEISDVELFPGSINSNGEVAGDYTTVSDSVPQGFVRSADGVITLFEVPNDTYGAHITGLNRSGEIVGWYWDVNEDLHGFVRNPNGTIITFDPLDSVDTNPTSILSSGEIVGWYLDGIDERLPNHGFVRSADGVITSFDYPDVYGQGTLPQSINSSGEITGWYVDFSTVDYVDHGFLREPCE